MKKKLFAVMCLLGLSGFTSAALADIKISINPLYGYVAGHYGYGSHYRSKRHYKPYSYYNKPYYRHSYKNYYPRSHYSYGYKRHYRPHYYSGYHRHNSRCY